MATVTSTTNMDTNRNDDSARFSMTPLLDSLISLASSSEFAQLSTAQVRMFMKMADSTIRVGNQILVGDTSYNKLTGPILNDLLKLYESSERRRQKWEDKIKMIESAPLPSDSSNTAGQLYTGAVAKGYSLRFECSRFVEQWSGAMLVWVIKTADELVTFLGAHRVLFDKLDAGLRDFEVRFCNGAPTGEDKGLSNVLYALDNLSIQEQGGGELPKFEIPGSFVEESEYNKWPDAEQALAAEGARLYKACVEALKYE